MQSDHTTTAHSHEGFPWKHVIGFILSLILTVAALYVVVSLSLSTTATITIILVLAIFQVLVQLLFFMHITEHEGAYQLIAIIFGIFLAAVFVAGSIWIILYGTY
ncbi:cytochrome aa3 quinol oxidase subunit IV [Pullulanibacillus pueri]|uniref:Quinol oxidase subunit 4 n=1 Tax=Pullulanibacillus pueri TaxID=1437324 RepID=A0A8J2ZYP5_9BACL|nr:cytochrome aa3 quinol oxidase subunit IV [Pullulanibacillus pueri]MBM7683215.1 cytochrome aa3 quinol oxidase subunit IV [Pullulanibacillus pueri]GGH85552.1 cytochrome aa3 quinol oxidase subunit IV [Pullulanibacillus pueri]